MNKKVIVYSTDYCAYCKQAKAYLKSKGVDFEEKNIEQDETANKELMDKIGGAFRGVPVLDIGGELLQGFDRSHINMALENF
ncbi:MAG: glutathione S-transferase N-terminal domain-containing protein [Candidatus Nomurabacteria bacterium]|jgi:glutaredoxin-like YruB-family protein|nr:glutathione S-transferase N-terminal domain-containing protein [Candidatus Nomurabacteria bacterium]